MAKGISLFYNERRLVNFFWLKKFYAKGGACVLPAEACRGGRAVMMPRVLSGFTGSSLWPRQRRGWPSPSPFSLPSLRLGSSLSEAVIPFLDPGPHPRGFLLCSCCLMSPLCVSSKHQKPGRCVTARVNLIPQCCTTRKASGPSA